MYDHQWVESSQGSLEAYFVKQPKSLVTKGKLEGNIFGRFWPWLNALIKMNEKQDYKIYLAANFLVKNIPQNWWIMWVS